MMTLTHFQPRSGCAFGRGAGHRHSHR